MLCKYNIFFYRNFLFFASSLRIYLFDFLLLLFNVYILIFENFLFLKLLNKAAVNLREKLNTSFLVLKQVEAIYTKKLSLFGIGFRCWSFKKKNNFEFILLKIGFSRDIFLKVPLIIKLICLKPTSLLLKSTSKFELEQFASSLCTLKKFDIYKGKGLQSIEKKINIKFGKKS
jgi:hypothetical protein